jgi:hypothetical protein
LVFIESICTDEKLLMRNYKLKASNEDYAGSDPKAALDDFLSRVRHYEAVYQPLSDAEDMKVDEDEERTPRCHPCPCALEACSGPVGLGPKSTGYRLERARSAPVSVDY